MLPFLKSEQNQVLFYPLDSFCPFPHQELLASLLFLRTVKVDVSVRGARRGMGRTGLALVGRRWGGPE